jgi:TPR repeat protein
MKKLLIASLILAASHSTFAADKKTTAKNDVFAKATQLYEAKDFSGAFQEMQRIANTGNAQAIYNLGYMHQVGQGTTRDEKKPLQYYQDASNKGFGQASYTLAQVYRNGTLGVTKNSQKYKEFLDKASNQGSDDAIVESAKLLFEQGKPEYDQLAVQKLLPLLRKGSQPAVHLKAIYDLSIGVKNKNPIMQQQAVESLQGLAKKGYAPSLMVLGNMLANGGIVDQDLEQAKNIFTRLAAANYPNAKESLVKVEEAISAKKSSKSK